MSKFDVFGSHRRNNMRNRPYYPCRVCGNKITTCKVCLSNVGRTRRLVKEYQPEQIKNNYDLPKLNNDFEELKYFKQRSKSMDAPKENKLSLARDINFLNRYSDKNKLKCKTIMYPIENGNDSNNYNSREKKEVLHQIKTNNIPEVKREDYDDSVKFRKDNDWNKMIHRIKNKIEDKNKSKLRKKQRNYKYSSFN